MEETIKKTCNCRVCGSLSNELFYGLLRDLKVAYYECHNCGYVQTELPYWLEQAYVNPIDPSDTGIMARNLANFKVTLATLVCLDKLYGSVVDYAGGYGILVRLLRDHGVNALWIDPFCENILAKGFEYQLDTKVDLVTAFEVFEHLVDPVSEMEKLLDIAPNVLISTQIIQSPAPDHDKWWYYGNQHGQHIGFFRIKTLKLLAAKYNKQFVTDGHTYHLFFEKKNLIIAWTLSIKRYFSDIVTLYTKTRLASKTYSDHITISTK